MSRARNIKPGFFKNELLVELPFEYRLLFVGLWTMADRDGRLEDRPTKIRMELFPADAVDVNAGLQALHDAGFVVRYETEGKRFIQVTEFAKHQNPHQKEAKSTIPAPCKPGASPVQAPAKADTSPADSLIPDSLIPEVKQQHVQPKAAPCRFLEFWATYPNKKGKQDAEKTWKRRKLDDRCDELIAHVAVMQATDADWHRGCAPMGSTYLNGARWEDVPKLATEPIAAKQSAPSAVQSGKPKGPSESPLERDVAYARQQCTYGVIDAAERDRLIAAATEKHRSLQ